VDTPPPELRHPEWLVKLVIEPLKPRNRLRTARWVLTLFLSAAVAGMFREVTHMIAMRLEWEPPPPRSGERMPGVDPVK